MLWQIIITGTHGILTCIKIKNYSFKFVVLFLLYFLSIFKQINSALFLGFT